MVLKVITILGVALCAIVNGHAVSEQKVVRYYGKLGHIGEKLPEHHEEYASAYPAYEFMYKVNDPHTHDMKGQEETRDGDEVKGMYWLIQPDGRKRTVTYHATKHDGFKAHVEYSDPHEEHIVKHEDEKHDVKVEHVVEHKHEEIKPVEHVPEHEEIKPVEHAPEHEEHKFEYKPYFPHINYRVHDEHHQHEEHELPHGHHIPTWNHEPHMPHHELHMPHHEPHMPHHETHMPHHEPHMLQEPIFVPHLEPQHVPHHEDHHVPHHESHFESHRLPHDVHHGPHHEPHHHLSHHGPRHHKVIEYYRHH